MSHTDSQPTPIAEHLKRLMLLRNVLACALVATMGAAASLLSVDLRWGAMAGVLLLLPTANLLAHLRLRHAAGIRDGELFAHLLIDVAVLSALLYLSGRVHESVRVALSAASGHRRDHLAATVTRGAWPP